jgi:Zn-dependent protease/predicted transcriptional regulator
MRWSFTVGRIAGIRVELHVTFLLFVGVIAVQNGLLNGHLDAALMSVAMMLLAFACVLLHELGHALTARRFGIRTLDIVLLPIGGVARLERMPDRPRQEILVAIAGPAVNLAILLLLLPFRVVQWPPNPEQMTGQVLPFVFFVNLAMLLFNLVPAFPMDGGRVLRATLAMRMPYAKATRIAATIGQAIALLFGLAGIMTSNTILIFIALFVFLAAGEERSLVQQRSSLSGVPVRAAMMTSFEVLESHEPVRRAVDLLLAGTQEDFPVVSGDSLIGLLSRGDLVRALQDGGVDQPVEAWAKRDISGAEAGEPLETAMMRMREHRQHALPVLQGEQLVGLLTLENVGDLMLVQNAMRARRTPGGAHA